MPANTFFKLPEGNDEIKFSQIRDMYDLGNSADNGFKKFRRNGVVVGSSTYDTDYNPLNNTAVSIPEDGDGDLKMSQFRGAYKEHVIYIANTGNNVKGPYYINSQKISTDEKRTYRFRVQGNLYHNSTSESWDGNGHGLPGIDVNVPGSNTRVIIHVTGSGKIGGGPGKGGLGGLGGLGGVSGLPGAGSTSQDFPGGDADCTGSSPGNDGENGSNGGNGGHCITVTDYPADEVLYIYKHEDGGFYPGGGGGGGAGGGGGGGAGETGGGGGKGAQGYNDAPQTRYNEFRDYWSVLQDEDGDWRLRLEWDNVRFISFTDDYFSYRPTSYSYGGKTYTQTGDVITTGTYDGRTYYKYAITINSFLTYFDGGNGSDGRRGANGSAGHNGGNGSMGRTLKSGGVVTTNDISGHAYQGDKDDVTAIYGHSAGSGATGATGTCNAGNGGRGGDSGVGGGGGGYNAGGSGGGIGAAGSNGGHGRPGRDGGAYALNRSRSGAENSCGGKVGTSGGNHCYRTVGGDDGGTGGAGGAAGTNIYNGVGATVQTTIL